MSQSLWVPACVRVYERALRILPADLTQEYGAEARSDFELLACRAWERRGMAGLVWTLIRGVADIGLRAPVECWRSWRVRRPGRARGPAGPVGPRRGRMEAMRDMMGEIIQAGRALIRRPVYAVIAVITLGLGIGANVAIFTVVDAVLLRPLPYPESDRIIQIRHHAPGLDLPELNNSPGLIHMYRRDASALSAITATGVGEVNLQGGERPARVQVVNTDVEFFDVFGTRPAMGRAFDSADVAEEAAPVAILMHAAWQSRFGGDPSIVGRIVELDGKATEIVGVMPAGFSYPDPATVAILPFYLDLSDGFGAFGIRGMAKLAPGVSLEAARSQLEALQARIPEEWTQVQAEFLERAAWGVSADRLRDLMVADIEQALWVLFGTVGLVLLIAAANVANLFLVRAEARQREVAIRSALGANRRRLATTFMAESLLLGVLGGAVGIVLAFVGVWFLVASGPAGLPRLDEVGVNGGALAFGALLGVLSGVSLGTLPILGRRHDGPTVRLREGGRGATAGRSRHRARKMLIATQVAMALVLLVGSGLMLRSVVRLSDVDTGISTDRVITVGVGWGSGEDRAAAGAFYDRAADAIAAIPGVESVGAVNAVPLDAVGVNGGSFHIESRPRADDELPPTAMYSVVTPGWFETVGIRLIDGRFPNRADASGAPVVWISEKFARDHFPDGAVGERIRFGGDTVWAEIAGVVNDVRTWGLREEPGLMAYYPVRSSAAAYVAVMHFAVRTAGDPTSILPAVRSAVAMVDPNVPLTTARTLDTVVASSMAELSFTMVLLAIASLVALLLGTVGLYGVISYVVAQRTQEMGIRIAMGARPADVRRMVVRQGMTVTLAGIGIGVLVAISATGLLSSMLFEVSARDPLTFVAVAALLTTVSLLAAWIPARRAAAVDPLVAMRAEWLVD